MTGRLVRSIVAAAVALVAIGSVAVASAGGGASGTLYRLNGTPAGTVTLTAAGGSELATVSVQGAQPSTTYTICVDTPFLEQLNGCSSGGVLGAGVCIPVVFSTGIQCIPVGGTTGVVCFVDPVTLLPICVDTSVTTAIVIGTLTTDASGSGTATLTVPELLSVTIVDVMNPVMPGDSAQALVILGP
ncbi:MAG: hypothetical protein ACYDCQ_04425 [Dehalococcoidia bacterium]